MDSSYQQKITQENGNKLPSFPPGSSSTQNLQKNETLEMLGTPAAASGIWGQKSID